VSVRSSQPSAKGAAAGNLTVDTAVGYLVARELVGAADIVRGDLRIVDAGRRNENLKVIRQRGRSYLLKQPGAGEPATEATIRLEAAFYGYVSLARRAAALRRFLPRFHGWDEDSCVLVLELLEGRSLWSHYAAAGASEFPADAASSLGEALGTLHRVFRRLRKAPAWLSILHAAPPWILSVHRPSPEIFGRLSPANLRLLGWLQRESPLTSTFDALREEWEPDTLVHNDLKGDNVLAIPEGESARVRIVDWELVQIGDAAWDVGAVFRDVLDYWLLSVPLSSDLTAEEMLEDARLPLAALHPAARAFWSAYCAAAGVPRSAARTFLLRSLQLCGARLAQGAYELSAAEASPSNLAIALLQLAANIVADPTEASLTLFGIPVPWQAAA
jgi:aminoglycoside phosphotransferase (APT) family kinase protein